MYPWLSWRLSLIKSTCWIQENLQVSVLLPCSLKRRKMRLHDSNVGIFSCQPHLSLETKVGSNYCGHLHLLDRDYLVTILGRREEALTDTTDLEIDS
jgi:hypothetical protein